MALKIVSNYVNGRKKKLNYVKDDQIKQLFHEHKCIVKLGDLYTYCDVLTMVKYATIHNPKLAGFLNPKPIKVTVY